MKCLVDTGATFSVLNQTLSPVSNDYVQVVGATGKTEKAYFLRPLKFTLGKRMGIHQFLDLPNLPKPLLGRDLLTWLQAKIEFTEQGMRLQVPEEKLILALSLANVPDKGGIPRDDKRSSNPTSMGCQNPGKIKTSFPSGY